MSAAATASSVETSSRLGGGTKDPNELVQWVLRESYSQTTEDLRFYAEKVKYFNSVKKKVRDLSVSQATRSYGVA